MFTPIYIFCKYNLDGQVFLRTQYIDLDCQSSSQRFADAIISAADMIRGNFNQEEKNRVGARYRRDDNAGPGGGKRSGLADITACNASTRPAPKLAS